MSVRPAAVAGLFYPADRAELRSAIANELGSAAYCGCYPKALIVPHAGYIYSAPTAACAYAALKNAPVSRVILVGPAHRVAFHGVAVASSSAFRTPLGDVPLAVDVPELASRFDCVCVHDSAHAMEHSLEVQLPFLQMVLGSFELLPLCVGAVEASELAAVLESLRGDQQTLFVISSDLSHYHPYEQARILDHATIGHILAGRAVDHEQACGATGINAMGMVAQQHGMRARLLDYRNSGDTAGDHDRVVGYASLVYEAGDSDG
ncbi:MAG: AmmeMemoRadiSam system protein B [Zetaproteobacteria bacterium CG12_big_fil_rev_8_21_14_0_65_54_13]|nr:MAG: AmmeMemoRadiSam system protein B [Zetaproteobacteria bacterium CG23_combo_of_CG06-09_8_20_14_all_54_7]PIW50597.1 MAG: AmmeMemoRadiSam system protein B [Zetaproteobacteria bacterium CG12_big_fil_rev_8_21_14_0_65_54_13]